MAEWFGKGINRMRVDNLYALSMALLLAGLSNVAHAEMFECRDREGLVSFQQVPCVGAITQRTHPDALTPAAQLHKCIGKDGSVEYQAEPCASGSAPIVNRESVIGGRPRKSTVEWYRKSIEERERSDAIRQRELDAELEYEAQEREALARDRVELESECERAKGRRERYYAHSYDAPVGRYRDLLRGRGDDLDKWVRYNCSSRL